MCAVAFVSQLCDNVTLDACSALFISLVLSCLVTVPLHTQWVPGDLSQEVMQPELKAGRSLPIADFKLGGVLTSIHHTFL
jgi:hypothetical protein